MGEIRVIGGKQMVQSDHPDGHWIPVSGRYDAAVVRVQDQENRDRWSAEAAARLAAAVEVDKREDARVAERQRQHEAALRAQAELELDGIRASVAAELRRGGCPESDVRALVAEAMRGRHAERAVAAVERGPAAEAELKAHFRRLAASAAVAPGSGGE